MLLSVTSSWAHVALVAISGQTHDRNKANNPKFALFWANTATCMRTDGCSLSLLERMNKN